MTIYEQALNLIKRHDEWTYASEELARPGAWDGKYAWAKEIVRLTELQLEHNEEYEKLYQEWRMKNEACNKAYAIVIPALMEARDEACDGWLGCTYDEPRSSRTSLECDRERISELRKVGL